MPCFNTVFPPKMDLNGLAAMEDEAGGVPTLPALFWLLLAKLRALVEDIAFRPVTQVCTIVLCLFAL